MSTRIGFGQMQLWFLLLAVFTLLCSSQPSEVCSIRNLLKELVVSNFFHGINLRNISTSHSPPNHNDTPGAILTVWGGDVPDSYKCQIDSHKLYAEKHGYTYYLINNMTELNWEYHVNSGQLIDIYWFKLLALLHVLKQEPKHPWVLYIDTDDIFENNYNQSEKDHNNMSIEDHLKTIQNYENIHMIFPDNHGWSTDFIFAKNTPMGVKFIEHFWSVSIHTHLLVYGRYHDVYIYLKSKLKLY